MGKKKSSFRRGSTMYDSDDDSESTCTTTSSELVFEQSIDTTYDRDSALEIYLDNLYEKRSSLREAGLKGLVESFSNNVMLDYCEPNCETLTRQYLNCIKKGSENEVVLACKALGLLSLTLGKGNQSEHVYQESSQILTQLIKSGSKSSSRVAAMESLSLLCVHGIDYENVEDIMECFLKIAKNERKNSQNPVVVRESAIKSWAFLFSMIFQFQRDQLISKSIFQLSSLLNDPDLSIKNAAGQAIALALEIKSGQELDFEQEFEFTSDTETNQEVSSDEEGEESVEDEIEEKSNEDHESIVEQMKALSITRNKRQSKKSNKLQKQNFREIINSIKGKSFSETKIKLKGNKNIPIYSWVQSIQINTLRKFLGSGFQPHLQENIQLYETFDFELEGGKLPEIMTSVEKRLYQSPNSVRNKARTQSRRSSRSMSQVVNHSILHSCDD